VSSVFCLQSADVTETVGLVAALRLRCAYAVKIPFERCLMKRVLLLVACCLIAVVVFAQTPNQPAGSYSLWSTSAVPAIQSFEDASPNELGVKFYSDSNGVITAIRFYKGPLNKGVHVAHLWDNQGNLLSSATFTNETASGWQQVMLPNPVPITAGTVYVASYWDPNGGYAVNRQYFTAQYNNGPLHALGDGASGANGVYLYNGSGFPTSTYDASNYWVDVVFTPSPSTSQKEATGPNGSSSSTAPSISSISPVAGPVSGGTVVTINGSNFGSGATVSFGSAKATSVQFIDPTELQAVTPAGAVGSATIVVANPNAGSASLPSAFTYDAGPVVASASPASGPSAGGTTVTITGSGFESGAMVAFGVTPAASVVVVSPTEIQAVTPAEAAATVGVSVTNPNAGPAALASGYTFLSGAASTPAVAPGGALLTGMTASDYTVPSGWTPVDVQGFESGRYNPGEAPYGASDTETIINSSTGCHTGTHCLDTYVNHSYGGIGMVLSGAKINSRTTYTSMWMYIQGNNPPFGVAYTDWYWFTRTTSPPAVAINANWLGLLASDCQAPLGTRAYGGCVNPAATMFLNGVNGAPNGAAYGGEVVPALNQWNQYEVYLKISDPNQDNGEMDVYLNGRRVFHLAHPWVEGTCPLDPLTGQRDCSYMSGRYDASQALMRIGGDWGAVIPGNGSNQNMAACIGGNGHTAQQVCPPNGNIPAFHIYIDDVIVLKK
jgi:hypothetical protein